MKQTGYSPYLPGWEYVPDGEPHVFGDRVFVFGSHDRFGGKKFCENDYVCWSAPLHNLTEWSYHGVIYKKTQDPDNPDGKYAMWAPDVVCGSDGRYYLYYCLGDYPKLNVAVCDTPAGKYKFYGYVHDANGGVLGQREQDSLPFDPGVFVDDDGRIHLYSGQAPMGEQSERKLNPLQAFVAKLISRKDKAVRKFVYHMELETDMLTLRTEPKPLLPNVNNSKGTGFEGHEFFEASSMRKFEGRYYFIYSSVRSHELCYAVSDYPDRDFRYGGTLISNGDVGLGEDILLNYNSKPSRIPKNYTGNTHGSIEKLGRDYFVFYHRQTNRNMHTRQGTVERIRMAPDGSFPQAEMTSQGFHGTLPGDGHYEARIACNLWSREGCVVSAHPAVQNKKHPAFTQDEPDSENGVQYIGNMRCGATAGFKYFDLRDTTRISVRVRGNGSGVISVCSSETGKKLAQISIASAKTWTDFSSPFQAGTGHSALFFIYEGTGAIDFLSFTLNSEKNASSFEKGESR